MIKLLTATAYLTGSLMGWIACEGCFRDAQTWGGGAANENWTYIPGLADADGHCLPNCNYNALCRYTGKVKFHNGGTGPRDIIGPTGVLQVGLAVGATWGPVPVGTIKSRLHRGRARLAALLAPLTGRTE